MSTTTEDPFLDTPELRAELAKELKDGADIMQWLLDLQNGCPLEKYRADFERTNLRAADWLSRHAAKIIPK